MALSASESDVPTRPSWALTTYLQQAQSGVWDVHASFLPGIYLDGVTLAGGIATLLPPQPVDADIAARVTDGLDGLIITGGRGRGSGRRTATMRTRAPTSRRATATPGSRAAGRGAAALGCRCWGSAAVCRCSTWPWAARCISTCRR